MRGTLLLILILAGNLANAEQGMAEGKQYKASDVPAAVNCLKAADVETLGDLVQFNKTDLLKFRNFGKKSLTELDDLLESLNLSFGTDISKYKLGKE